MSDPADSGDHSRLEETSDPRVVSDGSLRVSHATVGVILAMLIVMSNCGNSGRGGAVSNVWLRSKRYAYDRLSAPRTRRRCSQDTPCFCVTRVAAENVSRDRCSTS